MEQWGRTSRSGSDENVAKVKNLVSNHRLYIRWIAEDLNICKRMARNIISGDVSMRNVCVKWVPKVLSDDQEQWWVVSREMVGQLENQAF